MPIGHDLAIRSRGSVAVGVELFHDFPANLGKADCLAGSQLFSQVFYLKHMQLITVSLCH